MLKLLVQDAPTWRARFLRALGNSASVLCTAIPELGRLLYPDGAIPAVPRLNATESTTRFNLTMCAFVAALTSPVSGLTLFIDDLQWADSGSLALLQLLVTQDVAPVLLLGAYRSNEVDHSHGLMKLVTHIRTHYPSRLCEVQLSPLQPTHIQSLLVDSFRVTAAEVGPVADFLQRHSQGNPMYLLTILRTLYDRNLLRFDFATGVWQWDVAKMPALALSGDILDLLCTRMVELGPACRRLLEITSCLGHQFSLQTLKLVMQQPESELIANCILLERAGLIVCTSHAEELVWRAASVTESGHPQPIVAGSANAAAGTPPTSSGSAPAPSLSHIQFAFLHDRIQAAAYRLIAEADLLAIHLRIVERLLASYSEEEQMEFAGELCGHINVLFGDMPETKPARLDSDQLGGWVAYLAQPKMFETVVELGLQAGMQAKAAQAYSSAIKFLQRALQILDFQRRREEADGDSAGDDSAVNALPFFTMNARGWKFAPTSAPVSTPSWLTCCSSTVNTAAHSCVWSMRFSTSR